MKASGVRSGSARTWLSQTNFSRAKELAMTALGSGGDYGAASETVPGRAANRERSLCRESGKDITTAWQGHRQFETAQIDAAAFRIFTASKTGERRCFP